jgi:hypothetical protein
VIPGRWSARTRCSRRHVPPGMGRRSNGSTISIDLIMLAGMSASEFTTLDLIVKRHEEELIEDALADLPEFILERQPRVMFENNGLALGRWLMFGRSPHVEWLELSSVSYYVLTERFVDGAIT